MNISSLFLNFINTPVLFFFMGMLAIALKSNLEIPQPIPKFFSLYLLFAIGIKGGMELSKSGFSEGVIGIIFISIAMSCLVPLYTFFILKKKFSIPDATALSATYGSVSAVTFITAVAFLQNNNIHFGGHMVAAMALMESPAIIVAVILYKHYNKESTDQTSLAHTIKNAFTEGSILMILGSFVIGLIVGEKGYESVKPFAGDMFKGILCLFLLDMGIVAAGRLKDLKATGLFSILFALLVPILNAIIGISLSILFHMGRGDALIFTVLCASASYIAVPAAMRVAIPQSNPSIYVTMSLAITFPFNVIVGIPVYNYFVQMFIK